jgi:hypothetical protein
VDTDGASHLTRERSRAVRTGRDAAAPVAVTHFFSSPGRRPDEVERALRELGITDVVMDEELAGDGYWHVAAFTTLLLTTLDAGQAEQQMELLAQTTGTAYDGWEVTLAAGEEQELRR